MSPSGIEPATDVLCHDVSVAFPTLLSTSYAKSESSIRNKKYVISYPFMISASKAVTTALAYISNDTPTQ